MEFTDYEERILNIKQIALAVLGQFGFVDNEDDEHIGTIFHRDTGLCIDISATDPLKIIQVIFELGKQSGKEQVQAAIRAAIGI